MTCNMHVMQVLLQPNKEVLATRVQERAALGSHFMPASLLESQLALVEMDPTAYTYGIAVVVLLLRLLHRFQFDAAEHLL